MATHDQRFCAIRVIIAVTFTALAASLAASPVFAAHRSAGAGAAPALDPSRFAELASGVVVVRSFTCAGVAAEEGTGFLVGDGVVMTARHVVKDGCRIRALVDGHWIAVDHWTYWFHPHRKDLSGADVATLRLHSAATGHVFSLRTSSVAIGANLAAIGHPLGNQLSITQGRVMAKGKEGGIPLLAVRLLGAEGASGSPLLDSGGNVVGILQQGLGSADILGQRTSGLILGIDLPSWWPSAKRDLCRAYPAGGILGCAFIAPPAPTPKPTCDLIPDGSCSGFDLSGRDLRGAYLNGIDLSDSDLSGANLGGANLVSADLDNADLTGANLDRTDLSIASLANAQVSSSQLAVAFLCNTLLPDGATHSGCGLGKLTP